MKTLKLLFVLFLGVTIGLATSCKKDDDTTDDGNGGDNPPAAKTCYIKKTTDDNGAYSTYEYNSDNKVIKVSEYDKNGKLTAENHITYNTQGNYINFTVLNDKGDTATYLVMHYSSASHPDSASVYMNMGVGLVKSATFVYTFTGDQLTLMETKADPLGTGPFVVSKNEYTYTGKNLTTLKAYSFSVTAMSLVLESTTDYTYDDKKNPFFGIGIDYLMGEPQLSAANNVTKLTFKDDKGAVDKKKSFNYTYEYTSNGYPSKATEKDFDNSHTEVTNMEYNCK